MDRPDQALEEARRAGIDLDLLDLNLALTYEQRRQMHDEALDKVRSYEEKSGRKLPETAIIRRTRSGVELRFKVDERYDVQCLG